MKMKNTISLYEQRIKTLNEKIDSEKTNIFLMFDKEKEIFYLCYQDKLEFYGTKKILSFKINFNFKVEIDFHEFSALRESLEKDNDYLNSMVVKNISTLYSGKRICLYKEDGKIIIETDDNRIEVNNNVFIRRR